jgi:hypothetical protein
MVRKREETSINERTGGQGENCPLEKETEREI